MITDVLKNYQLKIDRALEVFVPQLGDPSPVRDACAYALLNKGKRLRPAIVLMVAEALQQDKEVMPSALAVELFHTSSLVVDDLPCMDDDDERRAQPSVHKAYNESMALLVSYALIAAGYGCLATNAQMQQNPQACCLALENAAFNTGLWGATGGQFLDLFPPDLSLETVRLALHRKTVSLFEMAFVFGWLYGGGNTAQLELVKQAAGHYGMAYQIVDDMEDLQQDAFNERSVNIASVFGLEQARISFHVELEGYQTILKQLHIDSPPLLALGEFLLERCGAIS